MSIGIIFHSETGNTRSVAEHISHEFGGDLIEVQDQFEYNKLTLYLRGGFRARNGEKDPISPDVIDVSGFDVLVIGSPVWAWKPTPAINAAIDALQGCEGKPAVVYATCGGKPGRTLDIMTYALEERGVKAMKGVVFTEKDLAGTEKMHQLLEIIRLIKSA